MSRTTQFEHGVSLTTRDDEIDIFEITEMSDEAIDTWLRELERYAATVDNKVCLIHDFSAVNPLLSRAYRDKINEFEKQAPDVSGKAALILPKGAFSRALQFFLNTGIRGSQPALKTKIFFSYDDALQWLKS